MNGFMRKIATAAFAAALTATAWLRQLSATVARRDRRILLATSKELNNTKPVVRRTAMFVIS